MDRKDWTRIGLIAAVFLVPGGFVLGATLAARRAGKAIHDSAGDKSIDVATAAEAPAPERADDDPAIPA
jgi:hypothetical protein